MKGEGVRYWACAWAAQDAKRLSARDGAMMHRLVGLGMGVQAGEKNYTGS